MARTWDYLVVGAGMAGGLLAAGLAASGRHSVLLVDAGSVRAAPAPVVRPHVLEFDEWARGGAVGWSPEDVLPHFRSLESDHDVGDRPGHGSTGPVPVRRSPEEDWTPADHAFRSAAVHRGHPWAADHNAVGALGVSPLAMTADSDGPVPVTRLVRDVLAVRDSVTVRTVGAVERILFDGDRAVGVEVTDRGGRERLEAREVLLCAGGVGSPALLQRSGVGPADLLRQAGVEPLVDLPVGQFVQTHALIDVIGQGDLLAGAPNGRSFGMMARWNTGLEGATSGDLMAWTNPGPDDCDVLRMTGTVAHCLSRGRLVITAPGAATAPVINPGLLEHPLDGYRMRLMAQHLFDLASGLGLAPRVVPVRPGKASPGLPDPVQDLQEWVSAAVRPAGYYVSGCRVGAPGNPMAVVDPAGRVLGTEGLRVADESLMPALVKAHPWMTSAVIGSRMAEIITGCDPCHQASTSAIMR